MLYWLRLGSVYRVPARPSSSSPQSMSRPGVGGGSQCCHFNLYLGYCCSSLLPSQRQILSNTSTIQCFAFCEGNICMYTGLSQVEKICIPVCPKFRIYVYLSVPSLIYMYTCLSQVYNICIHVCPEFKIYVYLYVRSLKYMYSIPTELRNVISFTQSKFFKLNFTP